MPDTRLVLIVLAAGADPVGPRTPLFEAATPTLDRIARDGQVGRVALGATSLFEGFLALVGSEPGTCSEGACCALGAALDVPRDGFVARADLVTVDDERLLDPAGGNPSANEADALLATLDLTDAGITLHRVGGGRSVVSAPVALDGFAAPWEVAGVRLDVSLRRKGRARDVFDRSRARLALHDVNAVRLDLGENPANALWLHGEGRAAARPSPPPWARSSTVLVARGPSAAGLAGALAWTHVDGDGSAEDLCASALEALVDHEVVVVRATGALAPAVAGDAAGRAEAFGHVDARLAAPLLGALEERGPFVLAVVADGVFDTSQRAFTSAPVPYGVLRAGPSGEGQAPVFSEQTCHGAGHDLHGGAAFGALLAEHVARLRDR